MRLPKVEYGDVFQVSLTSGYGFIQCVKEAPKTKIEIIRVLPGVYSEKDGSNIEKIIGHKELFFYSFP